MRIASAVADPAMQYTASTVGRAAGLSEGELQGALGNLQQIVRIRDSR